MLPMETLTDDIERAVALKTAFGARDESKLTPVSRSYVLSGICWKQQKRLTSVCQGSHSFEALGRVSNVWNQGGSWKEVESWNCRLLETISTISNFRCISILMNWNESTILQLNTLPYDKGSRMCIDWWNQSGCLKKNGSW